MAFAVLAVVLLTVGENLHAVAAWNLSYEMAPAPARARYLATFSLGVTGQQILGPVLMTAVMLPLGSIGWALLAVVFALAALVVRATGGPRAEPEPVLAAPSTPTPTEVTT